MGKYEVEDQIAAAKELGKLSFIDQDRIGIWGWSLWGIYESLIAFKRNDVFNMAIAVAPVTSGVFMILFIQNVICRLHKKMQVVMMKIPHKSCR